MCMRDATIYEQGNGLPGVGQYVLESTTGVPWRIDRIDSPIQTNDRRGNYVYARVERASWHEVELAGGDPDRAIVVLDPVPA